MGPTLQPFYNHVQSNIFAFFDDLVCIMGESHAHGPLVDLVPVQRLPANPINKQLILDSIS